VSCLAVSVIDKCSITFLSRFHCYMTCWHHNKFSLVYQTVVYISSLNPLNTELNPICHLLALLGVHHFLHVSRIRVKSLTLRLLMSFFFQVVHHRCVCQIIQYVFIVSTTLYINIISSTFIHTIY